VGVSDSHIFRVTVRGRFFELSDSQRGRLVGTLEDHHITKAAYTDEGTFTFDSNIYSFSLRYEIRTDSDCPEDAAAEIGLAQAETFLHTLGIGYQKLKVTTTDMRSMWAAASKNKSR
jgi:hypothetical protein